MSLPLGHHLGFEIDILRDDITTFDYVANQTVSASVLTASPTGMPGGFWLECFICELE